MLDYEPCGGPGGSIRVTFRFTCRKHRLWGRPVVRTQTFIGSVLAGWRNVVNEEPPATYRDHALLNIVWMRYTERQGHDLEIESATF